jgi:hypothetical protein
MAQSAYNLANGVLESDKPDLKLYLPAGTGGRSCSGVTRKPKGDE